MSALLIKHIFTILHVITAAAWFGMALRLAGKARTATTLDPPAAMALVDDGLDASRQMNLFAVLTLVFGLAAFFVGGGFGSYGPVYHTSILLVGILVLVQFGLIHAGWKGLASVLRGDEGASDRAGAYRKRIAMGVGAGHLLWLVVLILMFWNRLSAAVR